MQELKRKDRVSEGVISDIAYVYTVKPRALKSKTPLIHSMHYPRLFLQHFDIIAYKLSHTASSQTEWLAKQCCLCSPARHKICQKGRNKKGEYCKTNLLNNAFLISLFFLFHLDIHHLTRHLMQFHVRFFILAYISQGCAHHFSVLLLYLASFHLHFVFTWNFSIYNL